MLLPEKLHHLAVQHHFMYLKAENVLNFTQQEFTLTCLLNVNITLAVAKLHPEEYFSFSLPF